MLDAMDCNIAKDRRHFLILHRAWSTGSARQNGIFGLKIYIRMEFFRNSLLAMAIESRRRAGIG